MASKIFVDILAKTYRLVYSAGAFNTKWGWRVYSASYRWYKWIFDNEITILANFIQPGDIVLDIGANVGASSLTLAKLVGHNGTVIAIEPDPRNCSELRRVVSRSKQGERVLIIEAAVSDKLGTVFLKLNPFNPGDSQISFEGIPVNAVTVDYLVQENKWPSIKAIKVDVQGAEPFVMMGAKEALKYLRPIIFSEIYEEGLQNFGYTVEDFCNALYGMGYRPSLVENMMLRETSTAEIEAICSKQGYLDAVFLPIE